MYNLVDMLFLENYMEGDIGGGSVWKDYLQIKPSYSTMVQLFLILILALIKILLRTNRLDINYHKKIVHNFHLINNTLIPSRMSLPLPWTFNNSNVKM